MKTGLDDRELATVLAALRLWQRHLEGRNSQPWVELSNMASNDGQFEPLSPTQIDELCERLNFEED